MDFKKLREQKCMTQIEVANAVGVSVGAYRIWEQGGGNPTPENLLKLKKLFVFLETLPDTPPVEIIKPSFEVGD